MDNKKLIEAFNKIRHLTQEGKVLWKEEADGNTFYASLNNYKVYIGKSVGTVSFELFNQYNICIGQLEHGGYSESTPGLDIFYELVRRKVLQIDDGLDDLLDQLDQI